MKRARTILGALACLTIATGPVVFAPSPAVAQFPAENGLIAFQVDTGNGNQIFTVETDGSDLQQVTHLHDASTPDWSPDGGWIAFSRNGCSIALIRPDGTDLRKIPSQTPGGCETDPAFMPNGKRVVSSATTLQRTMTRSGSCVWTDQTVVAWAPAPVAPPRPRCLPTGGSSRS